MLSCYAVGLTSAALRADSVNATVPKDKVLSTAIEWATRITQNSPDSVQSTKKGLILAASHGNVEEAVIAHTWSAENKRAVTGDNIKVTSITPYLVGVS